jgi:hypothetical protein
VAVSWLAVEKRGHCWMCIYSPLTTLKSMNRPGSAIQKASGSGGVARRLVLLRPDLRESCLRFGHDAYSRGRYARGRVVRERTAYGLVNEGGRLKINSSTVLSSVTL